MLRKGGKFLPAYEHFAGSGFFQQVDAAHQSAFACAGQADDAEDLSLPDGQIDILQGMNGIFAAAECFAYAFQADNGLLFHRFLSLHKKALTPLFMERQGRIIAVPPCVHFRLCSRKPYQALSCFCAITGAPVEDYLIAPTAPGPCSAALPYSLSPNGSSLGRAQTVYSSLRCLCCLIFMHHTPEAKSCQA